MKRSAFLLVCLLTPATAMARTPDFAGRFSMDGQNGPFVVALQPAGNGQHTGTLSNGNLTWQIRGEVEEGALTGLVDTGQGTFAFEAHVSQAQLQLILVEIGPDGVPLVDQGQEFVFSRDQARASPQLPSSRPFPGLGGGAPADAFTGSFSNGELTLTLQGQDGNYSGKGLPAESGGSRAIGATRGPRPIVISSGA